MSEPSFQPPPASPERRAPPESARRAPPESAWRPRALAVAPLLTGLLAALLPVALAPRQPSFEDAGVPFAGPEHDWYSLACGASFDTRFGWPASGPADTRVEVRCTPDGRDEYDREGGYKGRAKQIVTDTDLGGGLVLHRRCDAVPPDLESYCGNAHVARVDCDASLFRGPPRRGAEPAAPLVPMNRRAFVRRDEGGGWWVSFPWGTGQLLTAFVEPQGPKGPVPLLWASRDGLSSGRAYEIIVSFAAAALAFAGARRLGYEPRRRA